MSVPDLPYALRCPTYSNNLFLDRFQSESFCGGGYYISADDLRQRAQTLLPPEYRPEEFPEPIATNAMSVIKSSDERFLDYDVWRVKHDCPEGYYRVLITRQEDGTRSHPFEEGPEDRAAKELLIGLGLPLREWIALKDPILRR